MNTAQISRDSALKILSSNQYQFLDGKALTDQQLGCLLALTANWVELVIGELWNIYELSENHPSPSSTRFKAWLQEPLSLGMWASRRNLANSHLVPFDGAFDDHSCRHLIEFRLVRRGLIGEALRLISEQI